MTTNNMSLGLVSAVHTTALFPLGMKRTEDTTDGPKSYRYAINKGADTTVVGDVVGWFSTTPAYGHVSSTAATIAVDAVTSSGWTAGVAAGAAATGEYFWLQTGGYCTNVTTDTGVAAGHGLVLDGTTDRADSMAAGEEHLVFGRALIDDTSSTSTKNLLWCDAQWGTP